MHRMEKERFELITKLLGICLWSVKKQPKGLGITWSVFNKLQSHKNVIMWPEFLNRRLKPMVCEAGQKKSACPQTSETDSKTSIRIEILQLVCLMDLTEWAHECIMYFEILLLFSKKTVFCSGAVGPVCNDSLGQSCCFVMKCRKGIC